LKHLKIQNIQILISMFHPVLDLFFNEVGKEKSSTFFKTASCRVSFSILAREKLTNKKSISTKKTTIYQSSKFQEKGKTFLAIESEESEFVEM